MNTKRVKGQVTIFISMVMMCVFALLCGLLESARTAGARWYLQTASSSALDSVFSQYHRQLWDSYRLLFVEYEDEEELETDYQGFIQPYLEESGWYPMRLESSEVEEWLGVTDDNGACLEEEILDYMKYGIWELDFDADTVTGLWENAKEAEAVREVAETYRGRAGDALKLEKSLEAISKSQDRQLDTKRQGLSCLRGYDGPGFRRVAEELIRELKRMPGLVERYRKQADKLAEDLGESRGIYEEERQDCSSRTDGQLAEEIRQFEAYIDQDGERRQEIEALDAQSRDQIALVEAVIEEAEEVERIIDEWESEDDEDEGPNLHALWSPVIRHFDQLRIQALSFRHGVKDKKTEGFLKKVEELYRSGLLRLVVPEEKEISAGVLETLEIPSETEIWSGGARNISLMDHLMVNEYCGRFFRCFPAGGDGEEIAKDGVQQEKGTEGKGGLSYEVEYMIGGKDLDEENLVFVVNRLLAIREGLNLIHILSDSQKRQEAQNLAMLITGVAGLSPLVLLTTFFVMSIWALGESLMDIRGLLAGKQVMLFKSSEDWTLDLDQLVSMGQNGEIGTGGGERGLVYLSWLKILLIMDEIVCQEYRMMDMIQMNICRVQKSFRMRRGIYQVQLKNSLVGKHVFFSLGFVEQMTGSREHTYPMENMVERKY
ncbi:MAG: hypothetical protein HFG58_03810 [Lachnospiraceae bacterium]|nr:hypothetical protein [Lachnospiraceae bacterium]